MRRLVVGVAAALVALVGCGETEFGSTVGLTDDELCHQHDDLEWHCHKLEHGVSTPGLNDIFTTPDVAEVEKEIDCEETPGAFGCPCTENSDCTTGYCIPSKDGVDICTDICLENCPDGFSCKLISLGSADPTFLCIQDDISLCKPCDKNEDCKSSGFGDPTDRCVSLGAEEGAFCATFCAEDVDCGEGYSCREVPENET